MTKPVVNTELTYLYRDACNYKLWTTVVLPGTLTIEELVELKSYLQDGEFFLPGQVELPDWNKYSGTEDDTPFFEFCSMEPTPKSPDLGLPVERLLENFRKTEGVWDTSGYDI